MSRQSRKSGGPTWPAEMPTFISVPATGSTPSPPHLIAQDSCEWIICSILDSHPRLRLNSALAACYGDRVMTGLEHLVESTGGRCCVVVEAGMPSSWRRHLRQAKFETIEIPNDYPQSHPAMLLYTLLGRRLAPGQTASDLGMILIDAPAAIRADKEPPDWTPVGILDHQSGRVVYLTAPCGTPLKTAISAAGLNADGMDLFLGNPLRDVRISLDVPLVSGELAIHMRRHTIPPIPQPCIRCGWCNEVCPTGVSPVLALEAAQQNDEILGRTARAEACIACGLCDQICPSNLPLLPAIRRLAGFRLSPAAPVNRSNV